MTLTEALTKLKTTTLGTLNDTAQLTELDALKTKILGKKGELTQILKGLGQLSPEERPEIGQFANQVKTTLQEHFDRKQSELEAEALTKSLENTTIDVSLPHSRPPLGHVHPLQRTLDDIQAIFKRLGFSSKEGPEIESDYYNFEALNIPADHPARDMHDTFYLTNGRLLRTHTSPVQIHVMEKETPPIKIIVPGKVYRCDSDTSHLPVFHQIEGLYVDQTVTFADLKGTLTFFLHELFGQDKKVRFRPSYFPFTEPSCEVDVQCVMCNGEGCGLCKKTGWLEILGAGMVNQRVFEHVKYENVTGFAFGLGIERIAMLRYKLHDIRLFIENDLRFVEQF